MTNILKKIAHPLNIEQIDLFLEEKTKSFTFPYDILAEKIKTLNHLEDLGFKRINGTFKNMNELTEGLSKELLVLCFCDTKTSSKCFITLSFTSAQTLIQIFEKKDNNEALIQNEEIIKNYCKYLSTLFLQCIKTLDLVDNLSLEICQSPLPKKDCFSLDLQIQSQEKNTEIRLIFEPEFLNAMSSKIKQKTNFLDLTDNLPQVHLEVSPTLDTLSFNQKEINDLDAGDVILINTQFHPNENKGSFTLNLEQIPLAFARYKDGKIKILEAIKNSQEIS